MSFKSDNDEIFRELPPELLSSIRQYSESRTDEDLDKLILAALQDLGSAHRLVGDPNEMRFAEDLGLDSLALAEFVFFFEDVFKIKVSNDDLAQMGTLGELKLFLKQRLV